MLLLPKLLGLLLTLQLTLAHETSSSYYDAENCGISTNGGQAKVKRAVRHKRSHHDELAKVLLKNETNSFKNATNPFTHGTASAAADAEGSQEKDFEYTPDKSEEEALDEEEDEKEDGDVLTEKIMGGSDAQLGEFPWAVRLTTPTATCGGTLISSRHVLTAAHCFVKGGGVDASGCTMEQMMNDKEIIAGTKLAVGGICYNTRSTECRKEWLGEQRTVTRIGLRTEFFLDKCQGSMWDVVLLEMNEPVKARHACLPHLHQVDKLEYWKTAMLSFGYGADPLKGLLQQGHQRLQKVDLGPAENSATCAEIWANIKFDTFVCTKESYTKNVCRGDSGGGILAKWKKRHYLVGIISFGSSCEDSTNNGEIANAQVNMDVNLYSATIDKFLQRQTTNYHRLWANNRTQ